MKLRVELDQEALESRLAGISGFEGAWLDLYLASPEERLKLAEQAISNFNELALTNDSE